MKIIKNINGAFLDVKKDIPRFINFEDKLIIKIKNIKQTVTNGNWSFDFLTNLGYITISKTSWEQNYIYTPLFIERSISFLGSRFINEEGWDNDEFCEEETLKYSELVIFCYKNITF